jgi:hypothetical protein
MAPVQNQGVASTQDYPAPPSVLDANRIYHTRCVSFFFKAPIPLILPLFSVAVSCFNPAFTPEVCRKYYLFEPIVTAILMSLSSLALVIRVRAINDTNTSRQRAITFGLGALLAVQVVVHLTCCFFYHPLNLQNSQGCISAPKHGWVGIYWVVPTMLYLFTVSFYLSFCTLAPCRDGANGLIVPST